MTLDDLLDAWRASNVVNEELLALCSDEDLELKPGKGKTIRSNYVHIVGVRRMWCEDKLLKEAAMVPKLDWKTAVREEISACLAQTNDLMLKLFTTMEESAKPGRWSTLKFFAYCIAHEANHRAQVEIALRINGREPEDMKLYGLWEWAKK
jgi:uncharacterized damage-inducible protein DinB